MSGYVIKSQTLARKSNVFAIPLRLAGNGNSLTDRSQNIVVIFAKNNLQRSRDIDLPKMLSQIKLHLKKRH